MCATPPPYCYPPLPLTLTRCAMMVLSLWEAPWEMYLRCDPEAVDRALAALWLDPDGVAWVN